MNYHFITSATYSGRSKLWALYHIIQAHPKSIGPVYVQVWLKESSGQAHENFRMATDVGWLWLLLNVKLGLSLYLAKSSGPKKLNSRLVNLWLCVLSNIGLVKAWRVRPWSFYHVDLFSMGHTPQLNGPLDEHIGLTFNEPETPTCVHCYTLYILLAIQHIYSEIQVVVYNNNLFSQEQHPNLTTFLGEVEMMLSSSTSPVKWSEVKD